MLKKVSNGGKQVPLSRTPSNRQNKHKAGHEEEKKKRHAKIYSNTPYHTHTHTHCPFPLFLLLHPFTFQIRMSRIVGFLSLSPFVVVVIRKKKNCLLLPPSLSLSFFFSFSLPTNTASLSLSLHYNSMKLYILKT